MKKGTINKIHIGKILTVLTLLIFCYQPVEAQLLKKLKKRVKDAAEEAVIRKTEEKTAEKTEKVIDTLLSKKVGKKQKKKKPNRDSQGPMSDTDQSIDGPDNNELKVWSNYNFVPGDKIIFHDDLSGEENGEFPSRWDLIDGNGENAVLAEENIINLKNKSMITPLMEEEAYLPEVFTIEFDAYFDEVNQGPKFWQSYGLSFSLKNSKWYYPTKYPERGSEDYFSPIRIYRYGASLKTNVKGNTKEYET